MSVRQQDIADRLQLSRSLVSGILNDKPGVWASPETRRRVRDTARELGYRPSSAARSLRSGKTRTVAFVYQAPDSPAWLHPLGQISAELARFLHGLDHRLLIEPVPTPTQTLAHLEGLARGRACDAVVLWGTERAVEPQAQLLETLGMPFVVKGRFEAAHPHWPQVDFDHEGMVRHLVARFRAQQRRRIAYVGYDADEPFAHCLLQGFRTALGPGVDDDLILACSGSVDTVRARVAAWMRLPRDRQPEAIAVGADLDAWEGIELGLADAGRIIADSDMPVAGTASPPLRLLFGAGHFFSIEFTALTALLCERALAPLLRGDTPDPQVLRVLPALAPTPTRRLLAPRPTEEP
jgi:LacI family transcriptional regulator